MTKVPVVPRELLDEVVAGIMTLDLDPIERKLCNVLHGKGWSPRQAQGATLAYRRFLVLKIKFPDETIVPSEEVDEVWHAHILDTQKYIADCERLFGSYLHHFPYFGLEGDADRLEECFVRTGELYEQEFGEPIRELAMASPGSCSSCA